VIPVEVHDLLTALYHREPTTLTRPELDLLVLTLHTLEAEASKPVVTRVAPQGPSKPLVPDVSAPLVPQGKITAAEIAIRRIQLLLASLPPSENRDEILFSLDELLMLVQGEQQRRRRVGA